MSDENTNQESMKPEKTSEDNILDSSAYAGIDEPIPVKSSQDYGNRPFAADSITDDTNL
jgi:hypothetical protein